MQENEFKEKVVDVLELYFEKEAISEDVLNHITALCEKFAKDKCEKYQDNILKFLTDEWAIEPEKIKESIAHGIKRAPLPDFNWLEYKY